MNLPAKLRGLSPEGRQIRERHQGSLTIGLQGITVHPAERGRSQRDFLQDNVRRLHEIQARCKERDNNRKPQPMRATRESSASTTSSLKQVKALAPLRNGSAKLGRRSPNSEYEGSAHSDYFSLTDEQIESAASQLSTQYQQNNELQCVDYDGIENGEFVLENGLGHPSRSSSALSGSLPLANPQSPVRDSIPRLGRSNSPVMLRPLSSRHAPASPATVTTAHRQNSGAGLQLLSGLQLNQDVRKSRMDNLLSKIKNQKPSCELDYNTHYKNIENQHKLLLDSSDVLSLYGYGEGSSGTDTQRSVLRAGLNTAGSGSKPSKLVRAKSFERDAVHKKNVMTGRAEKSVKSSKSSKAEQRVQSTPSPQLRKRFSKSITNLSNANSCTASEHNGEIYSRNSSRAGTESVYINECSIQSPQSQMMSDVQSLQRSKSNLESIRRFGTSMNTSVKEAPQLDCTDLGSQSINDDRIRSADTSAILNISASSGDLNLNSTMTSNCNFNINDPNQSIVSGSGIENLRLDLRSESQAEGDIRMYKTNEKQNEIENSPREYHPEVYMKPYNDTLETEHTEEAVTLQERPTSSTPVPNAPKELQTGSSIPKLLNKREQQEKPPSPSTLRRSQSLKNIRQRQGEPPATYKRGKLPKYLLARKEEEKRLAEIAQSVDPECPPGHAPLPDHERRNTLHLLKKSQAEAMRELSSLPVAQDTLRVKKRRQDLEDKLMQIEDGLRIFSQPKVYVMNDD